MKSKIYTIGMALFLLVVVSGCAANVVELQPTTTENVRERAIFLRMRPGTRAEDDDEIEPYSTRTRVFPAVVVDVQKKVADNPAHILNLEDLLAWEKQHGRIPAGSMVLLHTGWKDDQGIPGEKFCCSNGVASFLFGERQVAGVGIDRKDSPFNTQGVVLEGLTNFDQLPATGVNLRIEALYRRSLSQGTVVSVKAFIPKE
jgi:kynurenine formamidase